jgi:hypothetical protein
MAATGSLPDFECADETADATSSTPRQLHASAITKAASQRAAHVGRPSHPRQNGFRWLSGFDPPRPRLDARAPSGGNAKALVNDCDGGSSRPGELTDETADATSSTPRRPLTSAIHGAKAPAIKRIGAAADLTRPVHAAMLERPQAGTPSGSCMATMNAHRAIDANDNRRVKIVQHDLVSPQSVQSQWQSKPPTQGAQRPLSSRAAAQAGRVGELAPSSLLSVTSPGTQGGSEKAGRVIATATAAGRQPPGLELELAAWCGASFICGRSSAPDGVALACRLSLIGSPREPTPGAEGASSAAVKHRVSPSRCATPAGGLARTTRL